MPFQLIQFLITVGVLFVVAFIISFPIILVWWFFKLRKIKKNIPDDVKAKILKEKELENQMKGGSYENGIKIKEEIQKRSGERIREDRGEGGIGGGGGLGYGREYPRGEPIRGLGETQPETFDLRDQRTSGIDAKLPIQPSDKLSRHEPESKKHRSNIDEDWENLA